jgi:hypothetical protein
LKFILYKGVLINYTEQRYLYYRIYPIHEGTARLLYLHEADNVSS